MRRCPRCLRNGDAIFDLWPDGRRKSAYCRDCRKAYAKDWKARNPDHQREWRAKNREKIAAWNASRRKPPSSQTCSECGATFEAVRKRVVCSRRCKDARLRRLDPEGASARDRAKNHRRRLRMGESDLRPSDLRVLVAKTSRCPLCKRRLVESKGYHPRRKNVDHIIPLDARGRNVLTNVRVLCQECNERRPRDGSDVAQLVLG